MLRETRQGWPLRINLPDFYWQRLSGDLANEKIDIFMRNFRPTDLKEENRLIY